MTVPHEGVEGGSGDPADELLGEPLHHQQEHALSAAHCRVTDQHQRHNTRRRLHSPY